MKKTDWTDRMLAALVELYPVCLLYTSDAADEL